MKRGLKDNTFQNYQYMYHMFVAPDFGRLKVQTLKKSDVKQFYNKLLDERGLRVNTIDNVHTLCYGGSQEFSQRLPFYFADKFWKYQEVWE